MGMGDALRQKGRQIASSLGDPGAFFMIDRARSGGLQPSERESYLSDVDPSELPQLDRYMEGRVSGYGAVPMAAAYEAAKPLMRALPESINRHLPEGFRYQEGVTAPPSMGNIAAVAQGAYDAGRVIPFHITNALRSFTR